jgi:hypothetical protein
MLKNPELSEKEQMVIFQAEMQRRNEKIKQKETRNTTRINCFIAMILIPRLLR